MKLQLIEDFLNKRSVDIDIDVDNFIACICSLFPVFSQYFSCLLLIFLIELVAGVLAYVYYQAVSDTLDSIAIKQSSKELTPNCLYDGSSGSTVPDWHR